MQEEYEIRLATVIAAFHLASEGRPTLEDQGNAVQYLIHHGLAPRKALETVRCARMLVTGTEGHA